MVDGWVTNFRYLSGEKKKKTLDCFTSSSSHKRETPLLNNKSFGQASFLAWMTVMFCKHGADM
ncbi:hypothetical protein EPI10_027695 [Gossypium australe]|uniref:Uncharacterized protein n=1 Tax=Gossypium australe TaxID=47621 RepID=A0A5B6UXY0_9ROSI|nr:hypothetical protein EPI10_027695 [Gossypium australe]